MTLLLTRNDTARRARQLALLCFSLFGVACGDSGEPSTVALPASGGQPVLPPGPQGGTTAGLGGTPAGTGGDMAVGTAGAPAGMPGGIGGQKPAAGGAANSGGMAAGGSGGVSSGGVSAGGSGGQAAGGSAGMPTPGKYGRKDKGTVMPDHDGLPGTAGKPLKVFIMMGQSNMLGYGKIPDLLTMANTQPVKSHMVDAQGNWIERKDVYEIHVMTGSVRNKGYLRPNTLHANFGVDYQFGHVMGFTQDDQILLLKAAIGNRGLGWDILPPGSVRYEHGGQTFAGSGDKIESWPANEAYETQTYVNWYAGLTYNEYTNDSKMVLDTLKTHFPDYNEAAGYEIAGFVWFQGARDSGKEGHAIRYEQNLVRLIKELRKFFNAPNAKFVCATLAEPGGAKGNVRIIVDAQLAVSGDKGKYPEFAGNVLTTDSNEHNPPAGPNSHYGGDAEFIYQVGNDLGWAMAELLGD